LSSGSKSNSQTLPLTLLDKLYLDVLAVKKWGGSVSAPRRVLFSLCLTGSRFVEVRR
jgi:hypothetical protein